MKEYFSCYFRKQPEALLAKANILLATTEFGDIRLVDNILIVPVDENITYKYYYNTKQWHEYRACVETDNRQPPVLTSKLLKVKYNLLFALLTSPTSGSIIYKYYRWAREKYCFPIVNRGKAWYDHLTLGQESELNEWYESWLDVTETLKLPEDLSWINDKLNKIEPEELL